MVRLVSFKWVYVQWEFSSWFVAGVVERLEGL